ncbi:MAG TPA: DUF2141 domain-containing protein [Sphingobium sp.]|nr:DUF2141 domain-containing protein [Sphingobium sp.]
MNTHEGPMSIRHVLLVPVALALPSTGSAREDCTGTRAPGTVRLTVEAIGLRNAAGEVAFTVYPDNPRRFLAPRGKLLRIRVPARLPVTRACFWLRPGQYALAQYHDENADHDFNRRWLRPTEGFGFSNDALTSRGVPRLRSVLFSLPAEGRTMRMRMRYLR